MAQQFGKIRFRQKNIIHIIITVFLLCAVFLTMVGFLYKNTEDEAYDMLHIQTQQIKDDLTLQIKSDRENLITMGNFASKLYADGENYNLLFESFKPIGLFSNIGILRPDNTFVTKGVEMDLTGKISFEEEASKGEYISGRTSDLTNDNLEIIRSAVPIKVRGEVVGILYGVIRTETINERYKAMAKELDAQLFVYDKESGNLIIDTIHEKPANISFLKDRTYNMDYSYEKMRSTPKGYTSFRSAFKDENLYVHYSTIEDFDWVITLARYESQVFAQMDKMTLLLFTAFGVMVIIMLLYTAIAMSNEKRMSAVTKCASSVRKTLLETHRQQNNITEALKQVCQFTKSRSAVFFDTDGEDFNYILPEHSEHIILEEDRKYFIGELFHYAAEWHKLNESTIGVMCIRPNKHLLNTNPDFYKLFKDYKIKEVSFTSVTNEDNRITILGVLNPARSKRSRLLTEDIAVCFSIALYNKKHLSRTELAATTDSLTGAANRVAYKKDILHFDNIKPSDFARIYIDVNELHHINNKYGHAAGDEMLIYVANTLKEVFFGHNIYRMGGDEFLVFTQGVESGDIRKHIDSFTNQLALKNYHVAIGMSFRTQNTNTEEMVREAEVRMYESKAQYYQNKEQENIPTSLDTDYVQTKTGILEIDTMLSVLKEHYNGIYRVSLNTDKARRILMPSYLGYNEDEDHFSNLLDRYINDLVHPDSLRAVKNFINYDALKKQLSENKIPRITYKKITGETVILSIYKLSDRADDSVNNTLWVFAKD